MVIDIKFRGIDDWNRPVFVSSTKMYYGSVNTLFDWDTPKEEIIKYFKEHINELEWFGSSFNCEPHGGLDSPITLNIVE